MPKPKKGARFGGSASHQKAIFANLATALFEHGRITTTEAKAKALRPYAEKLVTKAKGGTLADRREVLKVIRNKDVVHSLFAEIGPRSRVARVATPASSRRCPARVTTLRWRSSNWSAARP